MRDYQFLLDTNILSDLVRNPDGAVAARVSSQGEDRVCTSIVVSCELRFGAEKKGSAQLSARIEALLRTLDVIPLADDIDRHYAAVRVALERRGELIGPNDLLIAAHALALDLTLVTDNLREFSRVPGLNIENWLNELPQRG